MYTTCRLVAIAGTFMLAYFGFRLDFLETKVFTRFGFEIFNFLYLLVLIPSVLWMPMTLPAIERSSAVLIWIMRLDFVPVATGSLGLLPAVLNS